jgi:hypothetical protein
MMPEFTLFDFKATKELKSFIFFCTHLQVRLLHSCKNVNWKMKGAENWLWKAASYMELNPVKAGIVKYA